MNWFKNNKPQSLIDDVKESMRLTEDNNVSFRSDCDLLIDVLADKVEHNYFFHHDVFHDLFRKSLMEQFKKDQLQDANKLLSSLKKICDKHNSVENKYILVTSINLKKIYKLKSRIINGRKVSFFSDVPKKYAAERNRLLEKYKEEYNLTEKEDYQFCTISVIAPDPTTAYAKAVQALDVIRSLMQVGFKKNRNILAFTKEHEYPAQSIITLGKFHSLHLPTGKTAMEGIGYEDPYQDKEATKVTNYQATQDNLQKQIQYLKNTIFKDHVIDSLVSYIEALDQSDISIRFLKLWSVLEQLVDSDDTRTITARVSFFFEKRESAKGILESLRRARNIHVHKGSKPRNIEMKNFLLCQYIELLINFFLRNPFKHKDLESAKEFMSTSTDIEKIDKKIQTLKEVKEFIGAS